MDGDVRPDNYSINLTHQQKAFFFFTCDADGVWLPGDRNPHPLHFICDADGVWGIALLSWQIEKEASIMAMIRGLFGG